MGAITVRTIAGKQGSIRIPALGTVIGLMTSWTAKRRGDDGSKESLFDLRAVLRYRNQALFDHPEYASQREVVLVLNSRLEYLVETTPASQVRLEGNTLIMEAIQLCRR